MIDGLFAIPLQIYIVESKEGLSVVSVVVHPPFPVNVVFNIG